MDWITTIVGGEGGGGVGVVMTLWQQELSMAAEVLHPQQAELWMTDTQGKREGGKKKIGPLHGPLFSWTKMMRKIDVTMFIVSRKSSWKQWQKEILPHPFPPQKTDHYKFIRWETAHPPLP